MKLTIIIPAFNEEKNITQTLSKVQKSVKTQHEVLVIYDREKDTTVPVVRNFIKKYKNSHIMPIKNSIGSGKGAMNAIKTGFQKSKGGAIVVLMADLSDDISQIDTMYSLFAKGNDIVCASRYMKDGQKIGGPIVKTFLSKFAGLSLFYLFHIPTHDATNAFKLYNRKIFSNISIESAGGFEYSLEIILKAHKKGYKITEIPTVWKDRMEGASNFKILAWIPEYIKWYVKFLLSNYVVFITFLTLLSLASFWRMFSFNFFQDDYQFIWYALFHPLSHFLTFRHPGTPFEALILSWAFRLNPYPWEVIGLIMKVTIAFLIGIFLYKITNSRLSGFLASVFFAVSYVGLYGIDAFNYHVPFLAAIFILISLIFLAKSLQEDIKYFKFFVFSFLLSIFLDPARAIPTILLIPLFLFFFQKAKYFRQVKKSLTTSLIIFTLVGLPIITLWYIQATKNVSSQLEIFIKGMMTKPFYMITKTKDIGNYFATIANMFTDTISGLSVNPPKYETANYVRLWGILGFGLFLSWIAGFFFFFQTKRKSFGIISFLLLWTFLYYLPNWLQEPRAPMSSINHYLSISSVGYISLVAYLISLLKKRWLMGFLAIIFICVNIYKSNVFFSQQLPYRSATLAREAWNTLLKNAPESKKGNVFFFTGDSFWAGYSILSFGSYHFLISKNDPKQEDLPIMTNDEGYVTSLFCDSQAKLSQIYTWYVKSPGQLVDITVEQRQKIIESAKHQNCKALQSS